VENGQRFAFKAGANPSGATYSAHSKGMFPSLTIEFQTNSKKLFNREHSTFQVGLMFVRHLP